MKRKVREVVMNFLLSKDDKNFYLNTLLRKEVRGFVFEFVSLISWSRLVVILLNVIWLIDGLTDWLWLTHSLTDWLNNRSHLLTNTIFWFHFWLQYYLIWFSRVHKLLEIQKYFYREEALFSYFVPIFPEIFEIQNVFSLIDNPSN